jgi:hypothetical protein
MEPIPALPICFVVKGGLPQKPGLSSGGPCSRFVLVAVGAYTVAVAVTETRNWHRNGRDD